MKAIEFIKKNISIFSLISSALLLLILFIQFFTEEATGCAKGWLFIGKLFLIIALLFLIGFDLILKNFIKNRVHLNFLQLSILLLFYLYYSFTYN